MSAPDDPDDFKRQAEELAKKLLEGMRRPGEDPERAAYEARKELEDRAALEDYYRRTGQGKDKSARARTTAEMLFAASLEPCPHCGTREPALLQINGGGDRWTLSGPCTRCKQRRAFTWVTEGNPQVEPPPRQLGDARPSQIIRVGQLMAELDRVLPLVRERPETLDRAAWYAGASALDRAITCLNELRKFVPAGMKMIPDTKLTEDERKDRTARRERYGVAWLQGELDRLVAVLHRYTADAPRIEALDAQGTFAPPHGTIDRDALHAHEAWVAAGGEGPGRLEVVGFDGRGLVLAGVQLAGARLERVQLDRANLEGAQLQNGELREASVREANATSLLLTGATIAGGSFEKSALVGASFERATVDGTSFRDANLDRSKWAGASVSAASFALAMFGNARLDGAHFRGCSFVQADFRPLSDLHAAPTAGAVFEDCDLRGTSWAGRDVSNATFVRCKLAGASGKPAAMTNVTITDPDLSPEGDGSDIADAADVLDLWLGRAD